MNVDNVMRWVIAGLCATVVILQLLWLVPRLRHRVLPLGEVLARCGSVLVFAGLGFGTAAIALGIESTAIRLPIIMIGLLWLTTGLAISIRQDHGIERERREGR